MLLPPSLADCLFSLRPGAQWTCGPTYDTIQWYDQVQTQPTEEEVNAELVRLQGVYDSTEYMRLRRREYPDLRDQMDLLYHGYDTWKAVIQAVKDKYPKPQ